MNGFQSKFLLQINELNISLKKYRFYFSKCPKYHNQCNATHFTKRPNPHSFSHYVHKQADADRRPCVPYVWPWLYSGGTSLWFVVCWAHGRNSLTTVSPVGVSPDLFLTSNILNYSWNLKGAALEQQAVNLSSTNKDQNHGFPPVRQTQCLSKDGRQDGFRSVPSITMWTSRREKPQEEEVTAVCFCSGSYEFHRSFTHRSLVLSCEVSLSPKRCG